jgi:triphosphoribosyl-dephospho-CoA synthetase
LLKRAGSFEKYREVQETFAHWKDHSLEALEKLTEQCLAKRLSFGGSADLLALAIFVRKFSTLFYFMHQDETAITKS